MKITRSQLKSLIKEEMTRTNESSYKFSNNDWEQASSTLIVSLLMSGIESTVGAKLSPEDADEYATDLMTTLQRFGNPQLLRGINDIYREIERDGSPPDDLDVNYMPV